MPEESTKTHLKEMRPSFMLLKHFPQYLYHGTSLCCNMRICELLGLPGWSMSFIRRGSYLILVVISASSPVPRSMEGREEGKEGKRGK